MGLIQLKRALKREERSRRDAGFVVVWFAICGTVLMGLCGFAVDVGNWYLQISRMQNAIDAAALAGAPYLPTSPDAAASAADAVLAENKVPPAEIVYKGPDAGSPSYMSIKSTQKVDTVFLKYFDIPSLTFNRTAYANMRQPIAMGSPDNTMGIQRDGANWSTTGINQGYWLSENTRNRPKQNADRWSSVPCGSADFCSGGKNLEYTPGGRDFVVEVPPGTTGYLAVDGYDLVMHDGGMAKADPNDWIETSGSGNGTSAPTDVQLFRPDGYSFPSGNPVAGCPKQTYPPTGPGGPTIWTRICTVYIDGTINKTGTYHLVIDMPTSFPDNGMNSYSLRAGILTGPSGTIDMAASQGIKVYAPGRLVTRHDPGVDAYYYMARIPTGYAGSTVNIEMFDFGETGLNSVEFTWADGSPSPKGCTLNIYSKNVSVAPTAGGCFFNMKPVDGPTILDKRIITVAVPIPPSFVCNPVSATSCWIQVHANYVTGATQEGASFAVGGTGNPLRLYNSPN